MLTLEQQKMVEKNHNLIYGFMHKHKISPDYYGSAALGLCNAAIHYDPSFGTTFATYAYKAMLQQYLCDKKLELKYECAVSLDEKILEDTETTLKNLLADEVSHLDLESSSYIKWVFEMLPLLDLKIVLYKLRGYTLRDIGIKLGCSRQTILNHLNIIKKAIQENKVNKRWEVINSNERQKILKEINSLLG